jgi:hypothetical protein
MRNATQKMILALSKASEINVTYLVALFNALGL